MQYGGKYASNRTAKALAGNCAVLPKVKKLKQCIKKAEIGRQKSEGGNRTVPRKILTKYRNICIDRSAKFQGRYFCKAALILYL